MSIFHMVFFKFKPDICTTTQDRVCNANCPRRLTKANHSLFQILQEFLSLPQICKDSSQNLYIKSIRGGAECSTGSPSVS